MNNGAAQLRPRSSARRRRRPRGERPRPQQRHQQNRRRRRQHHHHSPPPPPKRRRSRQKAKALSSFLPFPFPNIVCSFPALPPPPPKVESRRGSADSHSIFFRRRPPPLLPLGQFVVNIFARSPHPSPTHSETKRKKREAYFSAGKFLEEGKMMMTLLSSDQKCNGGATHLARLK